jgi:hypothetical protein
MLEGRGQRTKRKLLKCTTMATQMLDLLWNLPIELVHDVPSSWVVAGVVGRLDSAICLKLDGKPVTYHQLPSLAIVLLMLLRANIVGDHG